MILDPIVSVPRARGLNPAATATAEPVEEPLGSGQLWVNAGFHKKDALYVPCVLRESLPQQSAQHMAIVPGHRLQTIQVESLSSSCLQTPTLALLATSIYISEGERTVILVFPRTISP